LVLFRRFQVVSDHARLDGAAGKGTCRSLHDEGCSTSCIDGVPEFGKSCTTSFLSLNYFCRSDQDVRKHVLKARGILLSTLITKNLSPLGPTTRHVTRTKIMALCEQGATQRGIAKTVGCGLATVARWWYTNVQGCQGRGGSRQHRCARRTPFRSPNETHQGVPRVVYESFFSMFSQVLLLPRSGLNRMWVASAQHVFPTVGQ